MFSIDMNLANFLLFFIFFLLSLGNTGWADAMSKVLKLGAYSDKKVGILSKAKRDYEVKKAKPKKKEGELKEGEVEDSSSSDEEPTHQLSEWELKERKRLIDLIGRVKPEPLKRPHERGLLKIATKGVVQLFNAVREQQKGGTNTKLGSGTPARKRESVFKNVDKQVFMNVLDGNKRSTPSADDDQNSLKKPKMESTVECSIKAKDENDFEEEDGDGGAPTWSALKQNFMLDAKLKDWDKE